MTRLLSRRLAPLLALIALAGPAHAAPRQALVGNTLIYQAVDGSREIRVYSYADGHYIQWQRDRRAQGGYSLARTSGRWWVEGAQLCRQQARPAPDAPQCESAEAYPRPGTSTASPDGQMLLILLKGWMEPIR